MPAICLPHILTRRLLRRTVVVLLLMASIVCAARPSVSDDFTDRRLTIGAKIFRALLAADVDLERKTSAAGNLDLCLVYVSERKNADLVAEALANRDDSRIRGNQVHLDIRPFAQCLDDTSGHYAGVFLTQQLSNPQLSQLVTYSQRHHIIAFSPFEGDIERGVPAGIAVEARVRPYLNLATLRAAGIRLKSFFLEVAKKYE